IDLNGELSEPLHLQLTQQIKNAVLEGRLLCGERLPSSRTMASALGISRNTVLSALDQLTAEGYLMAQRGSGTRIAYTGKPRFDRERAPNQPQAFRHRLASNWPNALSAYHQSAPDLPRPFRPGTPDVRAFPYEIWNASLRRAARRLDERAAGYG